MLFKNFSFLIKKPSSYSKWTTKLLSTKQEPYVITKEVGDKAVVTLNRPKYLNVLNVAMQLQLLDALVKFENKKRLIILKGAGNEAFSAGGDVLEAQKVTKDNAILRQLVGSLQVNLNLIHTYKVPIITFMNGVTLGGGAGYSYFSKYKIVTETTRFGMPESKIAFHPNAGGTYFLNRGRGKIGYYLGLSGNALKGPDVIHAGFATHFCLSNNLEKLEKAILNSNSNDNIINVIDDICEKDIPQFTLEPVMDTIDRCFSEPTIENIFNKLEEDGSDWANKTVKNMKQLSPTSLKVILKQLQRGKNFNLQDCLIMESSISANFYKFSDVYEGIRVVLVDKGSVPKWSPSKLEDVTETLIEKHFEPIYEETVREWLHQRVPRNFNPN